MEKIHAELDKDPFFACQSLEKSLHAKNKYFFLKLTIDR